MAKALLIIDYTNDFVADKGSLTVGKPAQMCIRDRKKAFRSIRNILYP